MNKLLLGLLALCSVSSHARISCGDKVMEDYQSRSFKTVKAIADGLYYLSDNLWYDPSYVHELEGSLLGISLGDRVMEDYQSRSFQTVKAIADGLYYLSDGLWYHPTYVNYVDCQDCSL